MKRAGLLLSLLMLCSCGGKATPSPGTPATLASTGTTHPTSGGDISGGGDLKSPDSGAAWVLSPGAPIRACVERSQGFPVAEPEIRQTIQKAYATWKRYIVDRHIGWSLASGIVPVPESGLTPELDMRPMADV